MFLQTIWSYNVLLEYISVPSSSLPPFTKTVSILAFRMRKMMLWPKYFQGFQPTSFPAEQFICNPRKLFCLTVSGHYSKRHMKRLQTANKNYVIQSGDIRPLWLIFIQIYRTWRHHSFPRSSQNPAPRMKQHFQRWLDWNLSGFEVVGDFGAKWGFKGITMSRR